MEQELEQFYRRFNINNEKKEKENARRFKNSLCKILEKEIGEISLTNIFRNEFIKYTGIEQNDFGTINKYTKIDIGQRDWKDSSGSNYIKFSDTCIGKAFQEDLPNVIEYIQVLFLINKNIIPNKTKEDLYKEINEIMNLFCININIVKYNDKYLLYPRGAKELDEELVNNVLIWLEQYAPSRKKFISALEKYQNKANVRNILDDLRLSLELLVQEIANNKKTLENNKSEIGKILKEKGINIEISNMYIKLFDYYTAYQNNNVKHAEKCSYIEIEFIIYLTGSFMRLLVSIM